MKSRVMRLSAAALLAGSAAATMAPHLTSYISTSAVVNAPVLVIRAPFAGVLTQGAPDFASPVQAGELLLRLDSERQDRDAWAAVRAQTGATRAEVAALVAHIAVVTEVREDLRTRIEGHDEAAALLLAAGRREARAALDRAEVRRTQARAERDRIARLLQRGAASRNALEAAQADLSIAEAEAQEVAARLDALDLEAQALARGIAIGVPAGDGGPIRQRLDDVTLLLAELQSRRAMLEGRLAALDAQDQAVGDDFLRRTTFAPEASSPGVVWRASSAEGTPVLPGDTLLEILDCSRRFVEVSLPGHLFERIRPGDPATVRFKGTAESFEAHVEAVGGAGARFDRPSLASDPIELSAGDIQVLVRLDPVDPAQSQVAASCDVGRTAEVRFAREGSATAGRILALAQGLWGRSAAPQRADALVGGTGRDGPGAS